MKRANGRRKARGRILAVQEERIRLAAEDGTNLLLVLSRNARASLTGLERMHDRGERVVVDFEGEPGMETGVLLAIRREGAMRARIAAWLSGRRARC